MRTIFLRPSHRQGAHYYAVYRCRCGKEFTARRDYKPTKSGERTCGCWTKDRLVPAHLTHGMRHTSTYRIWCNMKARCKHPYIRDWKYYGGRGIRVCAEWQESFVAFLVDMGPHPGKGYSLDRIDVDGDYTPQNCRWATLQEQRANRRK